MSGQEFWSVSAVTTLVLLLAVIGVYALLRFVGSRHGNTMEKIRVLYATYSVPIILAAIFGLGLYHSKTGSVCNTSGNNTAGLSCDIQWLLVPLLLISMPISWYWIRAHRRPDKFKNTFLDAASKKM